MLTVFGLVAVTAYAVDVISKIIAVDKLTDHPDVEIVGHWLVLHLVRNPGAAFSTSPVTSNTLPLVTSPTGTEMGPPVSRTS